MADLGKEGDNPGGVDVLDDMTLLVPERPGNQLKMDLCNILGNGPIGLMFFRPATGDVLRAGARVERVKPDHLVSLSYIAERWDLTRQAISLYTRAERGSGFPNPVARVTSSSPLWDWLEVTEWPHAHARIDCEAVVEARIVKEANRFLELHGGRADNLTRRLKMLEAA